MLYGYNKDDAESLHSIIRDGLKKDVALLSASGREELTLKDCLARTDWDYEQAEPPILIFLSFGDDDIHKTLQLIRGAEIRRPIFCALTAENIRWPLNVLIDHLREEDLYWKNRKKK
jgi:hypothetical protein